MCKVDGWRNLYSHKGQPMPPPPPTNKMLTLTLIVRMLNSLYILNMATDGFVWSEWPVYYICYFVCVRQFSIECCKTKIKQTTHQLNFQTPFFLGKGVKMTYRCSSQSPAQIHPKQTWLVNLCTFGNRVLC